MARPRRRKLLGFLIAAAALVLCAVLFLYSPIGVTRLRVQNRMFSVKSILVTQGEGKYRNVTQTIEVRNLFPWPIEVTGVGFHSKGEYSMVWGKIFADLPFTLRPWERTEIAVTYQFDEEEFMTAHVKFWFGEREKTVESLADTAACVKDFLLTDNLIFTSDDIPTGKAYSFTVNCTPEYADQVER